ncbi:MAG: hypothetical protein LBH24_03065, partial [Clostridiales bacterium]|nr:hypothetical protein [Clostridiales bacterium]
MKAVSLPGTNCYTACVLSVAQHFGIAYAPAFSDLWSETDFRYEKDFSVYASRRLTENLAGLGLSLRRVAPSLSAEAIGKEPTPIDGTTAIAGADAFFIPWSPIYALAHEKHFFIIQKLDAETLSCSDPAYQREDIRIAAKNIVPHLFDLRYAVPTAGRLRELPPSREAKTILRAHPAAKRILGNRIASGGQQELLLLGRYADAMIRNRQLYRHYLNSAAHAHGFDKAYFDRWQCLKNGLFKAHLLNKRNAVL